MSDVNIDLLRQESEKCVFWAVLLCKLVESEIW